MNLGRVLVGLLLAWMVLGPVLHQGLGVNHPLLPAWHMFRGWGSNIVVVELIRLDGPEPERIDRLAVLGFADGAPVEVRRLRNPRELEGQLRQICSAMPGADLRVHAKIGRIRGWQVIREGKHNACR